MATGSVLLLAIAAFTATSLFALKNTAYVQTEDNLRQFCYAITHFLDAEPTHLEPGALQKFCVNLGNKPNFRMTYIAHDGTVLADSLADPATLENHKGRPPKSRARSPAKKRLSSATATVSGASSCTTPCRTETT